MPDSAINVADRDLSISSTRRFLIEHDIRLYSGGYPVIDVFDGSGQVQIVELSDTKAEGGYLVSGVPRMLDMHQEVRRCFYIYCALHPSLVLILTSSSRLLSCLGSSSSISSSRMV